MRSTSSTFSLFPLPLLLDLAKLPVALLPVFAACSDGGRGAVEDAKCEAEVDAHLWFRLIEEVTVCTSCRMSVTGERSVNDIFARLRRWVCYCVLSLSGLQRVQCTKEDCNERQRDSGQQHGDTLHAPRRVVNRRKFFSGA